jgi:SagB-type dehydrogenase family enzyme
LALLSLLIAGGFVSECNADGVVQIDDTPALKQWAFHDLVFHSRSRMGRHNNPLGGTYRFFGEIAPLPAVKPPMSTTKVSLLRPDMGDVIKQDISLTQALEQRVSVRQYGYTPLTLSELSEFLYRAARVKDRYTYQSLEFTRRPYPSGGAIYELELYLTVDRCHGLPSGLYHYDPAEHALFYLAAPNANTEWLLLNAWTATAQTCRPEVLITITARFQRVSWKYESIAYATILKNVGALYQTMYLVATAMNLGPCALGCGNSDLFACTIAEDYYIESSVGEFMLGNRRI